MAASNSTYKQIDGKKYDRGMLVVAEQAQGKLGMSDAKKLLHETLDGGKYTDIEKVTMAYIREKYTFTDKADKFVRHEVASFAAKKAYKEHLKAESKEVYCSCRKPWDGKSFMIACDLKKADKCVEWYHGACVNVKEGEEPNKWACPLCKAQGHHGYYRQIDGVRYDRGLLEAAELGVAGPNDGRISVEDAKMLYEEAMDGDRYTDCEKRTMAYIRDHYKFTDAADKWLREAIAKWEANKAAKAKPVKRKQPDEPAAEEEPAKKPMGMYRKIKGIKYDRGMLEACENSKGGKVNLSAAKVLLEETLDGDAYTEVERRTMAYIRTHFEFTKKADEFVRSEIQSWAAKKAAAKAKKAGHKADKKTYCTCNKACDGRFMIACDANGEGCKEWYHGDCVGVKESEVPAKWACAGCKKANPSTASTSYYKKINYVKYDRGMLDAADKAVAGTGDGRISAEDAKAIWEEAADGNLYTDCEKRTLMYIKNNYKCTEKAVETFNALEKQWAETH